jgi:hypothetical protein
MEEAQKAVDTRWGKAKMETETGKASGAKK